MKCFIIRLVFGLTIICMVSACGDDASESADFAAGNGTARPSADNDARPQPGEVSCSSSLDADRFATADELWAHHLFLDENFSFRPTASPNHQQYLDWLQARMSEIPGIEFDEQRSHKLEINLWQAGEAMLQAGLAPQAMETVRISGVVPYTLPTAADGVSGRLVYVPADVPISEADVQGKIVLREATTGSIPNAIFQVLQWWQFDPDMVLLSQVLDDFERDWISFTRHQQLHDAAEAGAAGMVLMHDFPYEQVKGHYMPYHGEVWQLPGVYVGVDEAEALKQLAADGGQAQLTLLADQEPATTRHLVYRLPGASEERIVVTSHTDGVHALWDNGPLVMLEMARYFAQFPQDCLPKTLEFGFTTAHLYHHGHTDEPKASGDQYARELDHDYDTIAMVLVLEHLGALNYEARPRGGGMPGRTLVPTGNPEPISWVINEPLLATLALQTTLKHDMRQSLALRGADLPGLGIPLHRDMGGEGTAYHNHLIPTVAYIAAPWTLFTPSYSPEELMDKDLLHRQSLMFTDYLHLVSGFPRELLAGTIIGQRAARELLCALDFPDGIIPNDLVPGLVTLVGELVPLDLLPVSVGDLLREEFVQCEGTPADPSGGL